MKTINKIFSVALLLCIVSIASTADVNWKNTGGDRLWRNTANWQDSGAATLSIDYNTSNPGKTTLTYNP